MRKLILTCMTLWPLLVIGQEVRTYDGSNNNLRYTDWGATHTILPRIAPPNYRDGFNEPIVYEDLVPRAISNYAMDHPDGMVLFDTVSNLNDYLWAFGQFIDHDIILTESGTEVYCTPIPQGDRFFDPFNEGDKEFCIGRSIIAEGTGNGPDNPREHINGITAWIDGSAVYGSDEETANWLRSFVDGKLKVDENNLLPWNTIDGTYDADFDPNAPFMADDTGRNDKLMVAGDLRANENIMLACLHLIFVREHNRMCDELKEEYPDWTDEELYQYSRKYIGGLIQNITFNEWLPATGIKLPQYAGYNPNLNPNITNEFSTSAFRIGHTLVNSKVMRMDPETGDIALGGNLDLRFAFFNPLQLKADGPCIYIKGATKQRVQFFDRMLIDDLRNFLFGAPGSGGNDLASINIMRARERGVPDFNTIRENLGLEAYNSFDELNTDPNTSQKLSDIYLGDLNRIDSWVGILAEEPMENSIFGETTVEILLRQFLALRDGDRFYFQIDPVLTLDDKREILNTSLADVLMRNTCMENMSDSVLFYDDDQAVANDELFAASEVHIYPNPVIDQFQMQFESKESGEALLTVTDDLGRMVLTELVDIQTGINKVQGTFRTDLSTGVYFVKVRMKGATVGGKIVKSSL